MKEGKNKKIWCGYTIQLKIFYNMHGKGGKKNVLNLKFTLKTYKKKPP
jgi:hypothetical protein